MCVDRYRYRDGHRYLDTDMDIDMQIDMDTDRDTVRHLDIGYTYIYI